MARLRGGNTKQKITISLSAEQLKKAKILSAQRKISNSDLLAEQIESIVWNEAAYDRAARQALALMEKGFHLGGLIRTTRDELHDRVI